MGSLCMESGCLIWGLDLGDPPCMEVKLSLPVACAEIWVSHLHGCTPMQQRGGHGGPQIG